MTVKLDVSKIPQSSIAPDDVFIIKIPMESMTSAMPKA